MLRMHPATLTTCRFPAAQNRSLLVGKKSEAPPIVREALRSPGQPLDAATRARMEPRFGHDFSGVRVHIDSVGSASADAVHARAYTVGNDVVFGRGQYSPLTAPGIRLLAHELAHVAQQQTSGGNAGIAAAPIQVGAREDPAEREAEGAADRIGQAQDFQPFRPASPQAAPCLRRQPSDDQPKKEPPPLIPLPHPLDRLDIKITVPVLGGGSLEDLNKILSGPTSEKPHKTGCDVAGWRLLKTGMCCPQFSVNPDQCCPPYRLNALGRCCPTDQFAEGPNCVKSDVHIPEKQPIPLPHEDSADPPITPREPAQPLPPLTVGFPIYFMQNRPGAVAGDEKGLRSSFAPGGGEAFDQIVAWLKRGPEFSVQLTGKASSEGPPAHNHELGENRARSIANALIQKGISAARIMDPPNLPADCPSFSAGLHNCGDAGAAKPLDEKDRQVFARLFIAPSQPEKRKFR
jgi:Domain of unknown function (DUF4157)/OmpA family